MDKPATADRHVRRDVTFSLRVAFSIRVVFPSICIALGLSAISILSLFRGTPESVQPSAVKQEYWRDPNDSGEVWLVESFNRIGQTAFSAKPLGADEIGQIPRNLYRTDIDLDPLVRNCIRDQANEPVLLLIIDYGVPFRYASRTIRIGSNGTILSDDGKEIRFIGGLNRTLPTKLRLIPILGNLCCVTGLAIIISVMGAGARSFWRLRNRQCPICGYILGEYLATSGCPECGWNREDIGEGNS